jgi:hypothetical protein
MKLYSFVLLLSILTSCQSQTNIKESTKLSNKSKILLLEDKIDEAEIVVEKLQLQILRHKKGERVRTILSGLSLFTIGFLITFFYKGYIWWGAMIFGGMIFFRGLSMDID